MARTRRQRSLAERPARRTVMERFRNDFDVKIIRERVFITAPARHIKIIMNVKRSDRDESISVSKIIRRIRRCQMECLIYGRESQSDAIFTTLFKINKGFKKEAKNLHNLFQLFRIPKINKTFQKQIQKNNLLFD